jgi:hypothetical protein
MYGYPQIVYTVTVTRLSDGRVGYLQGGGMIPMPSDNGFLSFTQESDIFPGGWICTAPVSAYTAEISWNLLYTTCCDPTSGLPFDWGVGGDLGESDFAITPADRSATLTATLLNPPINGNNVQVDYNFGRYTKDWLVAIDFDGVGTETGTGTRYYKLGPGTHSVDAYACSSGASLAHASLTVPPTQQQPHPELVSAVVLTDAGTPQVERLPVGSVSTVTVPLGAHFRIGLEAGSLPSGTPLSATYELTDQQPATPLITTAPLPTLIPLRSL